MEAGEQAWTETGALSGEIKFGDDEREVAGPMPMALSLERARNNRQQRVIVVGDGDFIADAWIGNGGNRDLGNRLFNWLVDDTELLQLEHPVATDAKLEISRNGVLAISLLALFLLPAALFSNATRVWYRRRHG